MLSHTRCAFLYLNNAWYPSLKGIRPLKIISFASCGNESVHPSPLQPPYSWDLLMFRSWTSHLQVCGRPDGPMVYTVFGTGVKTMGITWYNYGINMIFPYFSWWSCFKKNWCCETEKVFTDLRGWSLVLAVTDWTCCCTVLFVLFWTCHCAKNVGKQSSDFFRRLWSLDRMSSSSTG